VQLVTVPPPPPVLRAGCSAYSLPAILPILNLLIRQSHRDSCSRTALLCSRAVPSLPVHLHASPPANPRSSFAVPLAVLPFGFQLLPLLLLSVPSSTCSHCLCMSYRLRCSRPMLPSWLHSSTYYSLLFLYSLVKSIDDPRKFSILHAFLAHRHITFPPPAILITAERR
jgi:hypothetical protein